MNVWILLLGLCHHIRFFVWNDLARAVPLRYEYVCARWLFIPTFICTCIKSLFIQGCCRDRTKNPVLWSFLQMTYSHVGSGSISSFAKCVSWRLPSLELGWSTLIRLYIQWTVYDLGQHWWSHMRVRACVQMYAWMRFSPWPIPKSFILFFPCCRFILNLLSFIFHVFAFPFKPEFFYIPHTQQTPTRWQIHILAAFEKILFRLFSIFVLTGKLQRR